MTRPAAAPSPVLRTGPSLLRSARIPALALAASLCLCAALAGCTPTVAVQAPQEPIVIHMNVKIEHEIRVKVEKDLEDAFESNDDIF